MSGGAGGLLLLLPPNLQNDMEADAKEHILALEEELLNAELDIPIYFAEETEELLELYNTLTSEGEVGGLPNYNPTLEEKIDLLFRRSQDLHFQTYHPSAQGSEAATSAMAALLQSVSNSGYQLVVTAPTPQPVKDQVVVNNSFFSMYSKCSGSGEYGWFTLWSGWRGLSTLHPYCGSLRLCWRCSKVTDDNHSCRTSV